MPLLLSAVTTAPEIPKSAKVALSIVGVLPVALMSVASSSLCAGASLICAIADFCVIYRCAFAGDVHSCSLVLA